ncbi:MAG: hypothetical protein EPN88_12400, partial [Bacteroidetes bacterium]
MLVSDKNYTKIVFKLYFYKEKRFLITFLVIVQSFSLFSQEGKNVIDTLVIQKDSVITDTNLTNLRKASANALEQRVTYNAVGSRKVDIFNKKVILIDK